MEPRPVRRVLPAAAAALALAGCGSDPAPSPAADTERTRVGITLSDSGCALSTTTVAAGGTTFDITNAGTDKIDEVYLLQGSRILAEKEGLRAGKDATFSLDLAAGGYRVRCPGAGPLYQDLTVTGSGTRTVDAAAEAAAAKYAAYVRTQVAAGIRATRVLTDAVRAGDLAAAARAYPAARVNWERIETVAESFGDLDPTLDARRGDVADVASWTGYHRIEQAVFAQRSLTGMAPVADRLDADLRRLQSLVATVTFQPADLANGASALLDEVAGSKISGEEENFSHVDLVDFQANVDGARAAFELLEPVLQQRDAALTARIVTAFDAVDDGLKRYRTGSGPADFRTYDAVTPDQQRVLAGLVDALAEPLSQVAAVLVRP